MEMTSSQAHKKIDILGWLFLLLPFVVLAAFLRDFIYEKGSLYSDLAISHYPDAVYLRQAILNWLQGGGTTFWSSTILSGYPFAADPLSGLWYLPGWLALVFSLPLGINLVVLLHLVAGSVGLDLFLRDLKIKPPAALLSALVFEASPILFLHFLAGHITLVYAVCWTPWLLYFAHQARRSDARIMQQLAPGVALGMMALADLRWAALGGLLWVGFAIFPEGLNFSSIRINKEEGALKRALAWIKAFIQETRLGFLLLQGILALCIAAPLLLPLLQYTALSTRSGLTSGDQALYSLPPTKLFGIFFPDFGGFAEWIGYLGGCVCITALMVWFSKKLRQRCSFWIAVAILSLLFSLGSYTPFYAWIAALPGFDLLRVPARALIIFGLVMDVLVAFAVDALIADAEEFSPFLKIKPGLALAFVATFVVALSLAVVLLTHSVSLNFVWGAVAISLAVIGTLLRLKGKINGRLFLVGALVLSMVDLWGVDLLSLQPRSAQSVFSEGEQAASYIGQFSGLFRVYSSSYSISQQTAANYGLQLADGIDPMQLSAYVTFMSKATGVPSSGYSVTLPEFASGDPSADNQHAIPDARLLGLLNVGYVVTDYDLTVDGLDLLKQFGSTRIYKNTEMMPRAWMQPTVSDSDASSIQPVQMVQWTSDKIQLKATGAGVVVLSEIDYPGWQVWVDGKPAEMVTVDGLLRAVQVGSGTHEITFVFRPKIVYIGIGIALLSWISILVCAIIAHSHYLKQNKIL